MARKVMMIGLDAGSRNFIDSSLSSLPNLRRAVETGVRRRLRSRTSELFPAAVWPTLYTGTPPGDHGVYYPMQWDPDAMCLRSVADWLYCEPFWYDLERRGLRVIALDVPRSWPSRLRRGVEITDWGAHDRQGPFHAHPPQLASEIRQRFGKPIGSEIPVEKSSSQLERMRDQTVKSARLKGELCRWLLASQEWDFFIAVFGETHRAGHLFWPSQSPRGAKVPPGALLEVYQAVDQAIGVLLDSVTRDETTVIILAAHGMSENSSQEHFVRMIMDRVNARFSQLGGGGAPPHRPPRQRSVMRFLREHLPARLQHAVGQAAPLHIRDLVVNHAITAGHDWSRTPALAVLASVTGYVRFNLRGRERHGILEARSERFVSYLNCLREGFSSFRVAETGEPLVKDITLAADEFTGPRIEYLPDAVMSWTGGPTASRIHSEALGTIAAELPTGRTGNHHPDGFAIVFDGRSTRGGAEPPGDILDVAPMVRRLLLNND